LFLFTYFFVLGCRHAAVAGARGWEPQRFHQEEHSQCKPTEARYIQTVTNRRKSLRKREFKGHMEMHRRWPCSSGRGRGGSQPRTPTLADKQHGYRIQRGKVQNFFARHRIPIHAFRKTFSQKIPYAQNIGMRIRGRGRKF
jgi:hypothetical protein